MTTSAVPPPRSRPTDAHTETSIDVASPPTHVSFRCTDAAGVQHEGLWHITSTRLGVGGFAQVFEAHRQGGGEGVAACKVIDTRGLSERTVAQLDREISTLSSAQLHPHVVRFHGATRVGPWLFVLMEKMEGDILTDVLNQQGLDEARARRVVRQLLRALAHLHRRRIVHGDVKPENILTGCDADCDIKLADFGSAALLDDAADQSVSRPPSGTGSTGTALYSSPEVLKVGECVSLASDMWSVGVATYVLLSGCFPFSSTHDALHRRPSFAGEPWRSQLSSSARAFIEALLHHDPARRLTAEEALHHAWLHPPPSKRRTRPPELRCTTPPADVSEQRSKPAVKPLTPTKRRKVGTFCTHNPIVADVGPTPSCADVLDGFSPDYGVVPTKLHPDHASTLPMLRTAMV